MLHAKDLLRALDAVGGDADKLDVEAIALEPLVRARHDVAARPAQGLPGPQDALRARRGRVRRGDGARDAGGHPRGDRRRHQGRARPLACRACARSRTARSTSTARCRSATSTAPWTGTFPDEEATTIAGLVIHEARTIPDTGQIFTFHGYRFQVLRKSRNRITVAADRAAGRA